MTTNQQSQRPRSRQGKQQQQQPPDHEQNNEQTTHLKNPIQTLLKAFTLWKFFLLTITIGSCLVNTEAYDTSAGLVVLDHAHDNNHHNLKRRIVARLSSWDAIYFVSTARRGYRFEQEWAFGSALPVAVRGVLRFLQLLGISSPQDNFSDSDQASRLPEAIAGILIANLSHLLSVLALYHLGQLIWQRRNGGEKNPSTVPLLAALLHIISPGGIFLSAPYAESSCSLLTFVGYASYARSCLTSHPAKANGYILLAGASFGLATWFRSNAILNGIPFAWEVLLLLPRLVWVSDAASSIRSRSDVIVRLACLGVGGVLVAIGSIGPQAVAYYRFCWSPEGGGVAVDELLPRFSRPSWCRGYLPSIFTHVQSHYWNVGFLRYWTPGNIPLFLLATPMLAILAKSGIDTLFPPSASASSLSLAISSNPAPSPPTPGSRQVSEADDKEGKARLSTLVRSAAVAQIVLAVLAATTYHVQIITRISSGYPLWYWWLADQLEGKSKLGTRVVVFMVMYASIQAALFTSFLPPA